MKRYMVEAFYTLNPWETITGESVHETEIVGYTDTYEGAKQLATKATKKGLARLTYMKKELKPVIYEIDENGKPEFYAQWNQYKGKWQTV